MSAPGMSLSERLKAQRCELLEIGMVSESELAASLQEAATILDRLSVDGLAGVLYERMRNRMRGRFGNRIMQAWDDTIPEARTPYIGDAQAIIDHLIQSQGVSRDHAPNVSAATPKRAATEQVQP
jgi:hypothetical protein